MRWRFSPRTFLIAVALLSVGLSFAHRLLTLERTIWAKKALTAQGVSVGGWNFGPDEWWPQLWTRDEYCISTPDTTLDRVDWNWITALGDVRELVVKGQQCNSPECLACIRRNRLCLRGLYFERADFSQQLADAVSDCPNLEKLVLRHVSASNSIQIRSLASLSSVYVKQSSLGDANIEWITAQPAIRVFELDGEAYSADGVLNTIRKARLEEIALPSIQLSESHVRQLRESNLHLIDLRKVEISNDDLVTLVHCDRVKHLKISAAQFAGIVESEVPIARTSPLRVDIHVLWREEVAGIDWGDAVDIRPFGSTGCFATPHASRWILGTPVPVPGAN
jgi:hypothetical protein